MRIICLASAKGGVGKTSLAASLGVAAHQTGEKVFLIDMDTQGSLYNWGMRRTAEEPAIDRTTPDKLQAGLTGTEQAGYTVAIIDTQGVDTAATSAAMRLADLTVIPARPSALDIEASRPTVAALMRLGRPFVFCLNMCPPGRSTRPGDAARALSMLGALALPFVIHRQAHVDAIGLGTGVTEHDDPRAAEEIRQLWQWIKRRIEGSHGEAAVA
jgi:chromosome partitioning protein